MKPKILLVILVLIIGLVHVQGQDFSAIVLHAEIPQYPRIAILAHISGSLHLHVGVENGSVVKVESDSPKQLTMLIIAAEENVKTWKFSSGTSGSFDVTYIFELSKNEANVLTNPEIELQLPTLVKIVARPVKPTVSYMQAH